MQNDCSSLTCKKAFIESYSMMDSGDLYHVDLTAENAAKATAFGGTVLLLNVPPGTTVGVDYRSFVTGEKFLGVKMLTPGLHLISTSPRDSHGGFAPISGIFCWLEPAQIFVRKWNMSEEILCTVEEEEETGYKQGVLDFDFDAGLAPYDLKGHKQWKNLSKFITRNILERILPVNGYISIMNEAVNMSLTGATPAEKDLMAQLGSAKGQEYAEHNSKQASEGGNCFYTDIPIPVDLRGADLTAIHLDKSPVLESLLKLKFPNNHNEILGELQFAFLTFVLCQSLQGLRQWKSLLSLMLGCESAFQNSQAELFLAFSKVLKSQLQFCFQNTSSGESDDYFASVWTESMIEESFLKECLLTFLSRVFEAAGLESGVDVELYTECQSISQLVCSKLGWQVENSDSGEYAPVVVTL